MRRELLLTAGASLVVPGLLAVAEGAARLIWPSPCPQASADERMGCLHVFSPEYGWALRPGIRLCDASGCISVNSAAQRGPQWPIAREPGTRRVVVLGDSVAFGMEVADGASWPERLARPGLEVVNLSVPGYGTDQQLLRLEREGLAYRPDAIVVGFCLANDLVDNALDAFLYSRAHPKPRFELSGNGELRLLADAVRLPVARRTATWLAERSVLWNVFFRRGAAQTASEQEEHWQTTSNALLANPAPLIDLATHLLLRIRERGDSIGASLLVAVHPTRRSYQGEVPAWERALRERWAREGLRTLWLADEYHARSFAWSEFAKDGTGHLAERGHAITAEAIATALQ